MRHNEIGSGVEARRQVLPRIHLKFVFKLKIGGPCRDRTYDQLIKRRHFAVAVSHLKTITYHYTTLPQFADLRRDKPLILGIPDLPVAQLRPVDPGYGALNIAGSSPHAPRSSTRDSPFIQRHLLVPPYAAR